MKLRWLLLLVLLISACIPETPVTDPPAEEIPTQTETPIPNRNEEPVEEPDTMQEPPAPGDTVPEGGDAGTPTETPTATPFVCAKLISPENGLELPAMGKVTFAWKPVEGADSYLLQFILPNDTIVTFALEEP